MSSAAPEDPHRPRQNAALGALMMTGAVLCFTVLDAILKHLVATYPVGMLAWVRNGVQVALLLALVPFFGARAMVTVKSVPVHVLRGACLIGTTVFITLALRHMPMVQTYAITFSTPLMAAALASLTLGETTRPLEWALISVGFVGVMVALRPDAPDAGLHLLFPLAMAGCNAVYHVLTRYAGRSDGAYAQIFHVGLWAFVLTSLALPALFAPMPLPAVALLAFGGCVGTLAHLLLVQAFRRAPTTIVSPMLYTQILWAALIGYVVFAEVPRLTTLVGGAVVILSGIALVRLRSA